MTMGLSRNVLRAAAIEAGARFGTPTCQDVQRVLKTRYGKNLQPEYVWQLLGKDQELCKRVGISAFGLGSNRRHRPYASITQHLKMSGSFATPALDWLQRQQ